MAATMEMTTMIEQVVERFASGRRRAATEACLNIAASRLGYDLPDDVEDFYLLTDGLTVDPRRLVFNGLQAATNYAWAIARLDAAQAFGLFPLTEPDDSRAYCVACKRPLLGKIFYLEHDFHVRLVHPSLDSLAGAILGAAKRGNFAEPLAPGYALDHRDRTADDDDAAERVVALAASAPGGDTLLPIALTLYSRARLERILAFLHHPSESIRTEAAVHLGGMRDLRAVGPLERLANRRGHDAQAARHALESILRPQ